MGRLLAMNEAIIFSVPEDQKETFLQYTWMLRKSLKNVDLLGVINMDTFEKLLDREVTN